MWAFARFHSYLVGGFTPTPVVPPTTGVQTYFFIAGQY